MIDHSWISWLNSIFKRIRFAFIVTYSHYHFQTLSLCLIAFNMSIITNLFTNVCVKCAYFNLIFINLMIDLFMCICIGLIFRWRDYDCDYIDFTLFRLSQIVSNDKNIWKKSTTVQREKVPYHIEYANPHSSPKCGWAASTSSSLSTQKKFF